MFYNILRGMDTPEDFVAIFQRETTSADRSPVPSYLSPFQGGATLKGKNLLPSRANFFL